MSFLDRLNRRRPTLYDIPGFAGGNLGDELDQQRPPVLTQRNQEAITRPRTVTPHPDQQPDTEATRPRAVNPFLDRLLSHPELQERERRTQPRDVIADDAQDLADLRNKPLGVRGNLGLVAQNIATNLGGHPLQTRRQRDIERATGQLQQDLAVSGEQYKQKSLQSQMDARDAAQRAAEERIRQGDERLTQQGAALEAKKRQDYLNNLIRVYNGQTDFDPENPDNADFAAELERAFGYKPKRNVRGSQLAVVRGYDPDGKPLVSIINKGSGAASEVTGNLPTTTEGQANRAAAAERSRFTQNRIDARAGAKQGGLTVDKPTSRRAAKLLSDIDYNKGRMADADEKLKKNPNDSAAKSDRRKAQLAGERAATELNNINAGYEAGAGEQGYPYYKQKGQAQNTSPPSTQGRTIEGAVQAFTKRVGRPPTQEEINRMRSALGQ